MEPVSKLTGDLVLASKLQAGIASPRDAKAVAFDFAWLALHDSAFAKDALSDSVPLFTHYPACADALRRLAALITLDPNFDGASDDTSR